MAKPQHGPRTAIRGSVSTPIPRGWITLDYLLAETGIGKDTLNNLRQRYRYVIPRSLVVPLTAGRGGAAFYPPETASIICRLNELRRESPNPDDCLWRLWLEGHPVDFWGWAVNRLETAANRLDQIYPYLNMAIRAVAAALVPFFKGRVRQVEQLADLADWALSAAAGEPDASRSLEDAEGPPVFDTFRKAGGLPVTAAFPRPEAALIELLSLRRLAEIAAEMKEEQAEQARRDCQAIDCLFATVASVDWNAARPGIDPNVAKVAGAKPEPPSWQARRAQRTRALPPPAILRLLSGLWRSNDFRAMIFALSVGVRRFPGYSQNISELLALAEWALSLFPRSQRNSVAMRSADGLR